MALHHATSGELVALARVSAPATQTTALVKSRAFEAIHLVVRSGESISPHQVAGAITLYCVEGAVTVTSDGQTAQMHPNDWLYLDAHVSHALHGLADSALLLTILFDRSADAAQQGNI